jgi:hypothetical protein
MVPFKGMSFVQKVLIFFLIGLFRENLHRSRHQNGSHSMLTNQLRRELSNRLTLIYMSVKIRIMLAPQTTQEMVFTVHKISCEETLTRH